MRRTIILTGLFVFAGALIVSITSPIGKQTSALPIREVTANNRDGPSGVAPAFRLAPPRVIESYGELPLSFEANKGQTAAGVKFLSRGRGYALFLTGNEAVLSLQRANPRNTRPAGPLVSGSADLKLRFAAFSGIFSQRPADLYDKYALKVQNLAPKLQPESQTAIRMRLVGENPAAKVMGLDELPGKSNYFIGNDPKKWRTNVPTYAKVKYQNVYPGVDLVYYGNQRQLE